MKLRIIEEDTGHNKWYYIERKILFFWFRLDADDMSRVIGSDRVSSFKNYDEASDICIQICEQRKREYDAPKTAYKKIKEFHYSKGKVTIT